jgi:hypothetical protein
VLLAIDLHEYFIDVKGIAITLMLSLQSSSVYSSEFDAPQPDAFVTDSDAAFSEQIFNISVAEIEAIVKPDGVTDDVRRESVALVCIHPQIMDFGQLSCQHLRSDR